MTKRAVIISAFLVIISVFAGVAYVYGIDYYRKYYTCPTVAIDYNRFPVSGIDISAHQGNVDWKLVADSKVSFAFLKATEGAGFVDKMFETNWKEAKKRNIIVGAYHFFKFNKDGRIQAQNFISTVKLTENDLPPVVDFEASYGNRLGKYNAKQIQKQLLKCLRELEKHYKCKPIIYTNVESYTKFIKGNFDEYPLWLCKLCNEPNKNTQWKFWQYTHKGSVPGIKGNVDMNIFNGSYSDFVNFIYKSHGKNTKKNAKTQNRPTNRRNPQNTARKA
ncbi:MAG: hypothetical protein J6M30_05655 [Bacteroidales bacterium]|nr:hypothetical protein [Bacteroidales bacterium]